MSGGSGTGVGKGFGMGVTCTSGSGDTGGGIVSVTAGTGEGSCTVSGGCFAKSDLQPLSKSITQQARQVNLIFFIWLTSLHTNDSL